MRPEADFFVGVRNGIFLALAFFWTPLALVIEVVL
jgi:hypothetical protein